MRHYEKKLRELDVEVCVVSFDAGSLALSYVRKTKLDWPLLVDARRDLYIAYGMDRGNWWNIYGPASIWAYLKLLVRGRRLRRRGSDLRQLGGDVLIDPKGIVRFHHVGSGPADRPAISELLEVIQS